ncbi:transposase [Conexibacter sp. DBS9H8]|uniref:transposase n=1 Tax=Conexibacter sp. DBS9H8 TaxID=2937801 RepID=UPI0035317D32
MPDVPGVFQCEKLLVQRGQLAHHPPPCLRFGSPPNPRNRPYISPRIAAPIRRSVRPASPTAVCPNASVCCDRFRLIKLSTDALDEIAREVWIRPGESPTQVAKVLKDARFAFWKNPGNLTQREPGQPD